MRLEWFLASVAFLWFYGLLGNKIALSLNKRGNRFKCMVYAWCWIVVGGTFAGAEMMALPAWIEKETLGPGIFVWLCLHGIFAILVCRVIIRLLSLMFAKD